MPYSSFPTLSTTGLVLLRGKKEPQIAREWPLIGHLHLFTGSLLPHISLRALVEKYGPVYTIRIRVHLALVMSSWELAKELFTTNDVATCSHAKFIGANHLAYNYAMLGFSPYGHFWRNMRKITALELLSNHQLKFVRTYVFHMLGTYVTILCNWLIL